MTSTSDDSKNSYTPMMAQWATCKDKVGDALLLFRLGDFYEAFGEDANVVSQAIDLTLTKRQNVPMCGIPWHASESYIDKLLVKGYSVAIAEQVQGEGNGKALMERKVVRVLTPATTMKSSLLEDSEHSLFVSVTKEGDVWGVAVVDVTTALFHVFEVKTEEELAQELIRMQPKELLCSTTLATQKADFFTNLQKSLPVKRSTAPSWIFDDGVAQTLLQNHFGVVTLEGFGLGGKRAATSAAGAILSYLKETLLTPVSHLKSLTYISRSTTMQLDRPTLLNLEIFDTQSKAQGALSLFALLNKTMTPMGARLLRSFLLSPLLLSHEIRSRQAIVIAFYEYIQKASSSYSETMKALGSIKDLERLMLRIQTGGSGPRDILSLANSLVHIAFLKGSLAKLSHIGIHEKLSTISDFTDLVVSITSALTDEPPLRVSEGNVIRSGINPELDELRSIKSSSQEWLLTYQNSLRETLGIKTLRVGYTRAFGYYIEVSRGQSDKIPSSFHRRQTLTNAERFISEDLKNFEEKVLTAEKRIEALETTIFEDLKSKVISFTDSVLVAARIIGEVDTYLSLASVAHSYNYVCPEISEEPVFDVIEGRHPIAERQRRDSPFVANDLHVDAKGPSLLLITGPNMAGKSTYVRQAALIAIMAQIGSFIPAKKATIGIVDRVFSRIGASDDLFRGQSTFMVEMAETASILNQATSRSLILLDEIGRGTSTYDGISIAWAVVEYLLRNVQENPRTLFATHYYELTSLENTYASLKNMTVAVSEEKNNVRFLYKVVPGKTDRSYGIFVAKLAGLPLGVIKRAEAILVHLEQGRKDSSKPNQIQPELFTFLQKNLVEKNESLACYEFLKNLDLVKTSPLDCFTKLLKFKNTLK